MSNDDANNGVSLGCKLAYKKGKIKGCKKRHNTICTVGPKKGETKDAILDAKMMYNQMQIQTQNWTENEIEMWT